ncbi:MAG: single-stranded DNA-binding protein [Actinomycetota bacterium]|nr:single-stranded DNA-binding protein [Actinomycetota bacterium]
MNSINLTGRLTRDPELRTTNSGTSVGDLRLAVPRRRGKDGEDRGAVFVDVVTFGGLAQVCGEHLEKGRQVAVSGRLELDEWETDAGERRSRHKVIADEVEFLGTRRQDDDTSEEESS